VDCELGLHPCRPNSVQQRVEVVEAAAWLSRLVWVAVGAQDAEDGPDVGQSLVADLLDGGQRLKRLTDAQYSVRASLRGMTNAGHTPSQPELADHTGLDAIYISSWRHMSATENACTLAVYGMNTGRLPA
jgi:hypothetical protein